MDYNFENIVPWNGANDTGRDVRMKWERNFERIKANLEELENADMEVIDSVIEKVEEIFLRKDQHDSTFYPVNFLSGLLIGDIPIKKHSDGVLEIDGDLLVTGGVTMYAQGGHTASTILDALPIDASTLSKEGGVLSVIGGAGSSIAGIKVNGGTYTPGADKYITIPNYPTSLAWADITGKPSWIGASKPSYSFGELTYKPTTLAGYGITDAYTKEEAASLLSDYVTIGTEQTITSLKNFANGLKVGGVLIKKHSDGVLEIDGDLLVTGGVTMYAQGNHTASTILDVLPIDASTLSKEGGVLSVIGGAGSSISGIKVNGGTYTPGADKYITIPNYPTSLAWADITGKPSWIGASKPSYSFGELTYKPTTLAGYGITDAYTKEEAASLLSDYVTIGTEQTITSLKNFANGLKVGGVLIKKHSDGVLEIDGDLLVTGGVTMYAQGNHTASTILDALPIDASTLSKEGGVLSVIGGAGPSIAGIKVNSGTYTPGADGYITIPNYPTSLAWADITGKPTTLAGYGITDAVTLNTAQTITGLKTITAGLKVSGRAYGSGDDEGIVIGRASNSYASLTLGDPTGIRSSFYLFPDNDALWRYHSDTVNRADIRHPKKSGTIALTSDLQSIDHIIPLTIYSFTASSLPNTFHSGVSAGFVKDDSGFGSYGSVLTVRTYQGGGGSLQLYAPYSEIYGGSHLKARFGDYSVSTGNSWTALKELAWVEDLGKIEYIKVKDTTTTDWSNIRVTNSSTAQTLRAFDVYGDAAGGPTTYGNVLEIAGIHQHWQPQLWFDAYPGGSVRHRNKSYNSNNWGAWHTILDTNNYTSFIDSRYIKRAGDTMTGSLAITETKNILLRPSNTGYTAGIGYDTSNNECIALWAKSTVTRLRWYAGKDMSTLTAGSMMGITPDFEISKASGKACGYISGSDIWHKNRWHSNVSEAFQSQLSIDLSSYDINKWYPCWITASAYYGTTTRLVIFTGLRGNKPTWATHNEGFSLLLDVEFWGSGWGTIPSYMYCSKYSYAYGGHTALGGVEENTMASTWLIYLRGGAVYYYWTNNERILASSTSGYSWSSGNYSFIRAPKTSQGEPLSGMYIIAKRTDNVASATKLQTARSIWGQSFDGTGNVSGNMTGVGSITASGTITSKSSPAFRSEVGTGVWSYLSLISGNSYWDIAVKDNDANAALQFRYKGAAANRVVITTSGSVGIGAESPSYKLHVAGDVYANGGWLRTSGAMGWYNETYGGGWYMEDSTYIKNYNSKRLKISGINDYYAIWLTSGGLCCEGYGGSSWYNGYGTINQGIANNSSQTPLIVAYRVGGGQSGANRLFSMELLNSGSTMWLNFGGAKKFELTSGGNFLATGGVTMYSDIRKKNIIESILLPLEKICAAPLFRFTYKDDDKRTLHIGSSAQYWQDVPGIVRPDLDGKYLTMDYNAMLSAVTLSLAKHTLGHEKDIERLKRENQQLKQRIEILERRVA